MNPDFKLEYYDDKRCRDITMILYGKMEVFIIIIYEIDCHNRV